MERDGERVTTFPDGRPEGEQPAWRHDFPIDWPQDNYVARRDFARFLSLTSLAFVAGHLWIGIQNLVRRARGKPAARRIASLAAVPVGGSLAFDYPEEKDICILLRPKEDVLLAFSRRCTHLSCAVVPRPDEGILYCPCHEGAFDLQNGRPVAGPPRRPLPQVTLEVRGGEVWATGIDLRTS